MTVRPLAGVVVVSLEQAVAAPFATRQLADLGARVIKIERPGVGDFARHYDETVKGQASYFVWLNRSKESVTLDFKAAAGREVLERLLQRADVLVQNLGPGAAGRLGLDHDTLAPKYPQLIVCDVSGYGATGPWADRKAYDMLVQAEAGLVSLTGPAEVPSRAGISIADIAAGMYAYTGVLTALYQRATSGHVSSVRVALFEALAEWMGAPAYYTRYGGSQPLRVGTAHATIAPYGAYPAGDGETIVLAIQSHQEWCDLCKNVLGRPELISDPRFGRNSDRVANRDQLDQLLRAAFAGYTSAELLDMLHRARIATARLRDVDSFLEHPSLAGRDRWMTVGSPEGEIEALRPPVDLSGVEPRMDPIPALGEHTDAVLAEVGFDVGAIAELRRTGVI